MSGADLRLFRRMRGIWWGLLVVGVVGFPMIALLVLTIPAQLGMYSQATLDDVGGPMSVIEGAFGTMSFVASLAAVILGATVGSVDYQRGVLRDLVLAGRPRWRIVVGRFLAAGAWLVVAIAASAAVVLLIALTLSPNEGPVVWGDVARLGLAYVPGLVAMMAFASGIAMLVGGRGPAIAIALVFSLIIDNVLSALPKVGDWWREVSMALAEVQVQDWIRDGAGTMGDLGGEAERSGPAALVVLVAWALLAFVVGTVRLSRRDL